MRISVGIDIAKEVHWVTAVEADGEVLIDRKLLNTPTDLAGLVDQLAALGGTVRVGLDVVGGIAGLAEAMLAEAGFGLVHVPGLAVNRARQGTVGGENKSDPRDARAIADQVRTRADLRPIEPATELDLEIRLLVGRRRDLVEAQTQRLSRLHDLLVGIFPGLERSLDLTAKGPLHLLTRFVTPAELRAAGRRRLVRHLQAAGGLPSVEALAERVLAAAVEQTISVPAAVVTARLIRELAAEALASRARLIELDRELEALLNRHPDAALVRSLPGMGVVLTAEFIAQAGNLSRFRSADALASTASYLRSSGWRSGEGWGYEVELPPGFDYSLADETTERPISSWIGLGLRLTRDPSINPPDASAVLVLPTGSRGPAFLLLPNFRAILRYNTAMAYALSVAHLSDRLRGGTPFARSWPRDDRMLTHVEREDLQTLLAKLGFEPGPVDGRIGPRTRAAVRGYQASVGLLPDGYASEALLERVRTHPR